MKKPLFYAGIAAASAGFLFGPEGSQTSVTTRVVELRVDAPASQAVHMLGNLSLTGNAPPTIQEQLVPHLTGTNLELIDVPEPAKSSQYPDSIVVAPQNADCAAEFSIIPADSAPSSSFEVSPGIFGKRDDMVDISKINGEEMFNGTYGHGDESLGAHRGAAAYTTLDLNVPTALSDFTLYLQDSTEVMCTAFETHVNDPNGGFPG